MLHQTEQSCFGRAMHWLEFEPARWLLGGADQAVVQVLGGFPASTAPALLPGFQAPQQTPGGIRGSHAAAPHLHTTPHMCNGPIACSTSLGLEVTMVHEVALLCYG